MIVIKTDYFTSFYDKTLKKGNKKHYLSKKQLFA
jgi:hypothetical protein